MSVMATTTGTFRRTRRRTEKKAAQRDTDGL